MMKRWKFSYWELMIKNAVEFMSKNYDRVEKVHREILALLRKIQKERQECLKENVLMKKEINNLKSEVGYLKQSIENQEQLNLKINLDIVGIPKKENKADAKIIREVLKKVEIVVKQIKTIDRV